MLLGTERRVDVHEHVTLDADGEDEEHGVRDHSDDAERSGQAPPVAVDAQDLEKTGGKTHTNETHRHDVCRTR